MASSAPTEGKAKRLTRQSIQLMKLAGRMKRTSIIPGKQGGNSFRGSARASAEEPITEEESESRVKTAEEEAEEAEMLAMLKDSYREVTGRAMPDSMSPEDAMAELRVLQAAAWEKLCADEEDKDQADSGEGLSALEKLRRGGKKARMSLRIGGIVMRADPTHGAKALSEDEWDETLLEMLKDSYREMTGHALPAGMSPGQAYAELRKLQVAAWQDEGLAELVEETEEEMRMAAISLDGSQAAAAAQDRRSSCREFDADELDADEVEDDSAAKLAAAEAGADVPVPPPPGPVPADLAAMGDSRVGGIGTGVDEDWTPEKPALSAARHKTGKDVFRAHAAFQSGADKLFEGWLMKKAPGMFASNKLRFFALFTNGEIHYFKAADMKEHKGTLTVEGLQVRDVACVGKVADGYGLTIRTMARLWQLAATNEGQAMAWKRNIDAVINNLADSKAR